MTRPNVSAVERLQTELNKASANIRLWRDKHSDLVEALRRQEAEPDVRRRLVELSLQPLHSAHVRSGHTAKTTVNPVLWS